MACLCQNTSVYETFVLNVWMKNKYKLKGFTVWAINWPVSNCSSSLGYMDTQIYDHQDHDDGELSLQSSPQYLSGSLEWPAAAKVMLC